MQSFPLASLFKKPSLSLFPESRWEGGEWPWPSCCSWWCCNPHELFPLRTDLFGAEVTVCEQEQRGMLPRDLWLNCPEQLGRQGGEESPLGGTGNCLCTEIILCLFQNVGKLSCIGG